MKDTVVSTPTNTNCLCGGKIIELFSISLGEHNGLLGPGSHTPEWEQSIGFACETCGLQYGEPIFHRTKIENIPEQIKFELKLYRARLKRTLTIDDLGNDDNLKHMIIKDLHGETSPDEKIKSVPEELQNLHAGDIVYVRPSGRKHDAFTFTSSQYAIIQLDKKRSSKTFSVLCTCFE